MNATSLKSSIKLILQPNSERADENQPGFVGPGSDELGLGDCTSGAYISTGDYGPYLDLRFYPPKKSEGSEQLKIRASRNRNCRPNSDDYHYFRADVEILGKKYKVKAWIRQNPATSLLYIEIIFEESEHVEPGELSPLAQVAQQDAFDFLSTLGVNLKPLPIEPPKTAAAALQKNRPRKPDVEPDDIPF
jgi:hypothetical protein